MEREARSLDLREQAGECCSTSTPQIVFYTPNINGGLVLNGFDGNDTFACDGSSGPITLNGMNGNDEFIFGQVSKLLQIECACTILQTRSTGRVRPEFLMIKLAKVTTVA